MDWKGIYKFISAVAILTSATSIYFGLQLEDAKTSYIFNSNFYFTPIISYLLTCSIRLDHAGPPSTAHRLSIISRCACPHEPCVQRRPHYISRPVPIRRHDCPEAARDGDRDPHREHCGRQTESTGFVSRGGQVRKFLGHLRRARGERQGYCVYGGMEICAGEPSIYIREWQNQTDENGGRNISTRLNHPICRPFLRRCVRWERTRSPT